MPTGRSSLLSRVHPELRVTLRAVASVLSAHRHHRGRPGSFHVIDETVLATAVKVNHHAVQTGTYLVYVYSAIPFVAAIVVALLVWRASRKERAKRELAYHLASVDPKERRRALDAVTDEQLDRNAGVLRELLDREQDPDVLDALAAAVARSRWEPSANDDLVALRRWVAGSHTRTTSSSVALAPEAEPASEPEPADVPAPPVVSAPVALPQGETEGIGRIVVIDTTPPAAQDAEPASDTRPEDLEPAAAVARDAADVADAARDDGVGAPTAEATPTAEVTTAPPVAPWPLAPPAPEAPLESPEVAASAGPADDASGEGAPGEGAPDEFVNAVRAVLGDSLERVELRLLTGVVLTEWSAPRSKPNGNGNGHAAQDRVAESERG